MRVSDVFAFRVPAAGAPVAVVLSAAILCAAGPVAAHVGLAVTEAPAGSSYKAVLKIGHGCAGSPTREIRVRVPHGMRAAKPMPKPGWNLETVVGPLARPYQDHGRTVSEGVTEIRWSGGSLDDAHYDEFVFVGRLPEEPGKVLYIPVVQLCEKGEHRWIEVPAEGQKPDDLREPAPALRLLPAR
ncbi:YcnI family copper-binding membrane protein [Arenibaculum pallidiluteum]|uniref:YcnI family copper-binding membrane protein n=1 Tax=Arenibaculum pallidiluteum TaxID=2812559 RepID=UPI001A96D782|nr:DUF1775 domain-containing protein [Arenibaculum pallidiluteum]